MRFVKFSYWSTRGWKDGWRTVMIRPENVFALHEAQYRCPEFDGRWATGTTIRYHTGDQSGETFAVTVRESVETVANRLGITEAPHWRDE